MISTKGNVRIKLLLSALVLFLSAAVQAQGTWAPLAHTAPHYNEGVMLLLTDGTVLCKTSSGGTSYGNRWDKLTPDINGSYANGTWTTIAPMADERLYFSTQILNDGRVYVAGGEYGDGGDLGEVYNPLTNTWTPTPQIVYSLDTKISDANSEILPDGRVLQAVVDTANTKLNYFWDPATNTYSHAASCIRRDNEAAWLKLPDNSVLFIDNYSTTSERYIPATNTWVNDGAVVDELFDPFGSEQGAAYMLPDGRGFFIGSTPTTAFYTPSGSIAPGVWTAGPALPASTGAPDAASAMMPNGIVLMALSHTPEVGDTFPGTTYFYEYNYITNTFTQVGAPAGGLSQSGPAFVTNMLSLPDGTILYCSQGDNQYYRYTPGTPAIAAGKPTLDSVIRINCDTFMATGLLFNGISGGAAYGDDWQNSTNYPIIRFTSGTNVYYARTYNWNRMGAVMTGGLLDTTMFAVPAGMPAGTYAVQVVVNGIPSDAKTYNTSLTITPSSASLCIGGSTTFTDLATIGTWSSNNTAIATINPTTGFAIGISTGATTITYSAGSCFATAPITVNTGSATIIGASSVCAGSTTTLTPSPAGGTWSSSAPTVAAIGSSSGILSGVTAGTANIVYTIGTCTSSQSVTVNAVPLVSVGASGPTAICPTGSVVLTATAGAGYTYQWKLAGSPIPGATTIAYTATTAGTYAAMVTNTAGCSATSAPVAVTTIAAPAAVITPAGPTTFCSGFDVVLNANTGTGLTYQWQSAGSPIPGATAASYTASTGATYNVVVTNAAGCSTTSAGTIVTVTAGSLPITGTTSVCAGATTTLADASAGGSWTSSNVAVATVGSGSGIVTGLGTGGIATITYTLPSGCTATTPVTVNSASVAAITGAAAVCVGQTSTLSNSTPGGTWSSSAPATATIGSSGVVTAMTPGTTTIGYTVSTVCGSGAASRVVTVNAIPAVLPVTGTTTACIGSTAVLANATPSGTWTSANTAIATVSTSGVVSAVSAGTVIISYTVTNGSGCSASALATFTVTSITSSAVSVAGPTSFCSGGSVVLTAAASTGATYQWKKDGVNIAGANAVSYTANATGAYTVFITTGGGCNSLSAAVVVTVSASATPSVAIAAPSTLCSGRNATFGVTSSFGGTTPSYLWFKNGVGVATGSSYTYAPVTGDSIYVKLTSNYPCVTVGTATSAAYHVVAATPAPNTVSISVTQSSVARGSVDSFVAIAPNGGIAPVYQWLLNGTPVAGATTSLYITDSLKDGQVVSCEETTSAPCASPSVAFSKGIAIHVYQVGIKQFALTGNEFRIIPNPNKGEFNVEGTLAQGSAEAVEITVTDMLGRTIYSQSVTAVASKISKHIVLDNQVADGSYLVTITTGGDHGVYHLVISR